MTRRDVVPVANAAALSFAVVGLLTGLISAYLNVIRSLPLPFENIPFDSGFRPVLLFLLVVGVVGLRRGRRTMLVLLVILALLQIRYLGFRGGDGMCDASLVTMIVYAERTNSFHELFDVSAAAFLASTALLVISAFVRRRGSGQVMRPAQSGS